MAAKADVGALTRDMAKLLDSATHRRSAEFSLARFAVQLMNLQMRQGIVPAPQFAFPLVSLMTLEGRIKASHPTLDFQAIASNVVLRAALIEGKVRKLSERPYARVKGVS